jgi:hypothetical protein
MGSIWGLGDAHPGQDEMKPVQAGGIGTSFLQALSSIVFAAPHSAARQEIKPWMDAKKVSSETAVRPAATA